MTDRDWFRSTNWDDQIQEAFFKRLSRSRSKGAKAQYLRIQAGHLQDANSERLTRVALELLGRMFSEYPEPAELAQGHLQKAQCLASLADGDGAIREYRAALEAERAFPNAGTQAWLDFGWFAVEHRRQELYPEISAVLAEFLPSRGLLFPVDAFRLHGIRALIAADLGRREEARREAQSATDAAAKRTSGLPRHPTIGLVDDASSEIACRLADLARGG